MTDTMYWKLRYHPLVLWVLRRYYRLSHYFSQRGRFERCDWARHTPAGGRWRHPFGEHECKACDGDGLVFQTAQLTRLADHAPLLNTGGCVICPDCWKPFEQKSVYGPWKQKY